VDNRLENNFIFAENSTLRPALLIFPILSFLNTFGQDEGDGVLIEKKLNEVLISATQTTQNIEELPIPVVIIQEKEITKFNSTKLYDVLIRQTGIVSVPTRTGTQGLQMQGLDPSYTTILIDGFPIIGRAFGTLDLNRISVTDIESIEVIKGASSSLYGSNALGGVVNLISKKQSNDGSAISSSLKLASYNTANTGLMYQYKEGVFQTSNSIDYYTTDGYDLIDSDILSTVNPYSNYTLRSNIRYGISEKLLLNANGHYYKQEQINVDTDSTSSLLEGETNIKEWSLGASLKYLMNANLSQEINIYKTNYRADEFLNTEDGILYDNNYFDHTLLQSEIKSHFTYKGINTIIGFGIIKEELSRTDFLNNPEQDLKFIYGQLDAKAFEKLNIILGSRYDNYTNYTPVISNKLALGFDLTNKIKLNSSVGTGFKTPDFRQKYFDFTNSSEGYIVLGRDVAGDRLETMENVNEIIPFSELNSPLKSETSLNVNVGLRYNVANNLSFDINLFNNKVNDLIEWKLIATKENINIYSYFNVNEVQTKGLEFNSSYIKEGSWDVKFGYQLLYAYDNQVMQEIEAGEKYALDKETLESIQLNKNDYFGLFNRSRHMGNVKLNYHLNNKIEINTIVTYRSKYALSDSNGNDILDTYDKFIDGYSLCDLAATYQISTLKSCQIGVKNIFGFTNPEYISNISGRVYYINLKINFK